MKLYHAVTSFTFSLKVNILFVLLVVFSSHHLRAQQETKGKDFWFGFMYNFIADAPLEVYITAERVVSGTVTIPGTGFSQTFNISANSTTGISIPNAVMAADTSDIKEAKAIHIVTCDTVSVYAINRGSRSDDAALIYPTPALGNEYKVLTKKGDLLDLGPEFLIVATQNNTSIEIVPTVSTGGGYPAGVPYIITLNQGDMYQVKSVDDLTGTTVKSIPNTNSQCSNFAVFSGNKCLDLGECSACDHLYEQLMPVSAWGKEFIVGSYAQKSSLIYRVLANANGTSFTINNGPPIPLNAGQFYDYSSTSGGGISYIASNNPVSVMEYMAGSDCDGGMGDPDEVQISPLEQTMKVATFYTIPSPSVSSFYANILTKVSAINQITLNGAPIPPGNFITVPANPQYAYATGIVLNQSTNYQLKSDSGFFAIVYGMGLYESYSYPVGSSVKDLYSDFSFRKPPSVCAGSSFTFQAIPDPNTASYQWDYGDGTTGAGLSSTHAYVSSGSYTVQLTKHQISGCDKIVNKYIMIPTLGVNIHGQTNIICPGQTTTLYVPLQDTSTSVYVTPCGGTITTKVVTQADSIVWSNGDTARTISVAPLVTTTYYVHAYIKGSLCEAIDSITISVEKPIANFSATPVCQAVATTFSDLSSGITGITGWAWDFQNDGAIDNTTNAPSFIYPASGTYTASLIVTSSIGCKDTVLRPVNVWGHSIPNFTPDNVCFGTATTFSNLTNTTTNANVGGIPAYYWYFTDGFSANTINPIHTFTLNGNANATYNVLLVATSTHNCIDSIRKPVSVFALPTASFTSDSVCLGSASHMADASNGNGNTINNFEWDFLNDGLDISGVPNPNYVFPGYGNNIVSYTVSSFPVVGLVCKNITNTITVWVNPNPEPDFTFTDKCINAQPNSFDANTSSIGVGTNTNYAWAYGDGSTGNGITTSHNYAMPSVYNVTLTVTSNKGCQNKIVKQTEVFAKPFMAIANSSACDGKVMTFTASTLPNSGNVTAWFWDFNQSIASFEATGQTSGYTFPAAGNQSVTLISKTDKGCLDTLHKTVYVDYVPVPQFTVNKPAGCPVHCVTFSDNTPPITGPAQNTTWIWLFGDGNTLTAHSGSVQPHCYDNTTGDELKSFDIKLVVITDRGCTDSIKKASFITVYPEPVAAYEASPNPGNVVTPLVYFTNQSHYYTRWWWNFGDGTARDSVNRDPEHFYYDASAKTYPTYLVVANQYGCRDTAYLKVDIGPEFTFYIPNAFTPDMDGINDYFSGKGIGIETFEMWVFDRWGEMVFYSDDITKGWDGKRQGKSQDCKQDVYVWKVKLKDVVGKQHEYVGHVTLIRK